MRFSIYLQENCNAICSDDYSFQTKNAMGQLSEKEMSFELIEVCF
jgi:ATP-dependent RNA helicase A